MGLSEDTDDNIEKRFEDLCLDLNLDTNSKEEAWEAFERISQNYTLEGDSLHWLACALYVACRQNVQTVRGEEVEGNCVSLTRLLRSSKLSLLNFFNKMKKWSDMANLPQDFRDKVDRLERNFAVSTVIFKKFEPIYKDIFRDPSQETPRPPRGRKQKRLPCLSSEVFSFCWTMFVQVKGNFPAISDDLVNSYHLLLCCIDWFYANALQSNKDLLNPNFEGLPENFAQYKGGTEVPCIISLLCSKHEGLVIEAKGIKEHWWKPYIKKLFDKKILKGKAENLTGILDISWFEGNVKSINNAYETYVLSVGDFDERIFLGEDADTEIGTPAKNPSEAELSHRMNIKREMAAIVEQPRSLVKDTPLTGRRYLREKETPVTPVSTATQSVSKLQSLLSGRKTSPSDELKEIFKSCSKNPEADIIARVKEMGEIFCTSFAKPSEDHPGSHADFAKKRLQLGESLYFKALENIMRTERRRIQGHDKTLDFAVLLDQDVFHRSLCACCLEIVLFSYNSQRTFPWIVEIFELSPYHFYKVIELIIRAEEGLSRDVVKHLNHIEEMILESEAFKYNSPLWEAVKQQGGEIPRCDEVSLPSMIEKESHADGLQSPLMHPAVKRITGVSGDKRTALVTRKDILQSPTGPSAADRFSSPSPGTCKRRLFSTGPLSGSAISVSRASEVGASGSTPGTQQGQQLTFYQQAQTEDGTKVLIPVQIVSPGGSYLIQSPNKASLATAAAGPVATSTSTLAAGSNKPKKTGSLALFFRKVYHLASVRLRHLCEMLEIDNELRARIWTCFEHTLITFPDMFVDRHLDQMLMCSVYVMAKVCSKDRSFQDIMKCYRLQPQARSHVYRSVLLTSRRRRMSGGSESSKNDASRSNSPSQAEESKKEDKKKEMRSTSTLPVPQPGSQPPTPTRLAGTASSFEFEDRGDLIKFYNQEYIKKIKGFALRFSHQNGSTKAEVPPLSPLPLVRSQHKSPRRVSQQHSLYISPIKSHNTLTPQSKMLYCFNRSPAKDLQAINKMLHREQPKALTGKRLLVEDSLSSDAPPVKRPNSDKPQIMKRVEEFFNDKSNR